MLTFGPVPSRRLGRSLGINNIPPKICSYSCPYCQVGYTDQMEIERRSYFDPKSILKEVEEKLEKVRATGEKVDYITFVPDGEPTLDSNLGQTISLLKQTGVKIAVISNASLIWRSDVREDLLLADLVSLKVDAADKNTWKKMNRPHGRLSFEHIIDGMIKFAKSFQGRLTTETMLISGINCDEQKIREIARLVQMINPAKAYLIVPSRPPADARIRAPGPQAVERAVKVFQSEVECSEMLPGYEGDAFTFTGNVEEELVSISSVHPMRGSAVRAFLEKANADWSSVQKLINRRKLKIVEHDREIYYIRNYGN